MLYNAICMFAEKEENHLWGFVLRVWTIDAAATSTMGAILSIL